MISGVHAIVFSEAADQVRAFFRDTLGLEHVDAGGGWLVFALPPAELAIHPGEASRHELYLMCDDLELTIAELVGKGVRPVGPVREQVWGRVTTSDSRMAQRSASISRPTRGPARRPPKRHGWREGRVEDPSVDPAPARAHRSRSCHVDTPMLPWARMRSALTLPTYRCIYRLSIYRHS